MVSTQHFINEAHCVLKKNKKCLSTNNPALIYFFPNIIPALEFFFILRFQDILSGVGASHSLLTGYCSLGKYKVTQLPHTVTLTFYSSGSSPWCTQILKTKLFHSFSEGRVGLRQFGFGVRDPDPFNFQSFRKEGRVFNPCYSDAGPVRYIRLSALSQVPISYSSQTLTPLGTKSAFKRACSITIASPQACGRLLLVHTETGLPNCIT